MRIRERKVLKDHELVRFAGEKGSPQNTLRQELYTYAFQRLEEANEQAMYFEIISICDMLITDRIEAFTQYLLHDEDHQFTTMSSGNAAAAFGSAVKDNAPELYASKEYKDLLAQIEQFTKDRNTSLHSFFLIKNAAPNVSLDERVAYIEEFAEEANNLVRKVSNWVNKNMKF